MIAPGKRVDQYRNYKFRVEIDGITRAAFQEASPFDSTVDVIEHREGGDKTTPRKLPGMRKYANIALKRGVIVLKRGVTDDAQLWNWYQGVVDGKVERKNGSLVLLDPSGEERVRWNFFEAWPTKLTGPSFNAEGNDVAIETLELAHEGLRRA